MTGERHESFAEAMYDPQIHHVRVLLLGDIVRGILPRTDSFVFGTKEGFDSWAIRMRELRVMPRGTEITLEVCDGNGKLIGSSHVVY